MAVSKIRKTLLFDEFGKPVAVRIDYADWTEIARRLGLDEPETGGCGPLRQFEGTIALTEDPVEYQARMRQEWQ